MKGVMETWSQWKKVSRLLIQGAGMDLKMSFHYLKLLLTNLYRGLATLTHALTLIALCVDHVSNTEWRMVLEDFQQPDESSVCSRVHDGDYVIYTAIGEFVKILEVHLINYDVTDHIVLFSTNVPEDGCDVRPRANSVYCFKAEPEILTYTFRINITVNTSFNHKFIRVASGSRISNTRPFPLISSINVSLSIDGKLMNLDAYNTSQIIMDRRKNSRILFCAKGIQSPSQITIRANEKVLASVKNVDCVRAKRRPDCLINQNNYTFSYLQQGDCFGRRMVHMGVNISLTFNGAHYDVKSPDCVIVWHAARQPPGIQFCLFNYPTPYLLTATLGKRPLLNFTNGPCVTVSNMQHSGYVVFQATSDCPVEPEFRCKVVYSGAPAIYVNGVPRDVKQMGCSIVVQCQPLRTALKFCAAPTNYTQDLAVFLGSQKLNETKGSCVEFTMLDRKGFLLFRIRDNSKTLIQQYRCRIKSKVSGDASLRINQKTTIDLKTGNCAFDVHEGQITSMEFCVFELSPPFNVSVRLNTSGIYKIETSEECTVLTQNQQAETFIKEYSFNITDSCHVEEAYKCSVRLVPKSKRNSEHTKHSDYFHHTIFLLCMLILHMLALIYCLSSSHKDAIVIPETEDSSLYDKVEHFMNFEPGYGPFILEGSSVDDLRFEENASRSSQGYSGVACEASTRTFY